jgi:hypothetical protein
MMAQEIPKSAAAAIYPHLPSADRAPVQRQQPRLAEALFPDLVPKSPQPAPRPRLTREQAFDWSNVDPAWARLVGLVPKGSR